MKKYFFCLIFFVFFFTCAYADENTTKINKLFIKLQTTNFDKALEIEQKIWKFWSTHPTNEKLTIRLNEGSELVKSQRLEEAIEVFTELINIDQYWAEAWNKRATVFYLIGEFQKSQNDIDRVLELEDRHFGALAGQGLVNIQLKNYEKAIKSYEKAQKIYPSMKSPKKMIKQIEKLIKEQTI